MKSLSSEITIRNGVQLHALQVDKLPKRHRIVVHVNNPKKPINEILDLIDRQNLGVGNDWVVAKGSENRDDRNIPCLPCLNKRKDFEALNFRPFCGPGQAAGKAGWRRTQRDNNEG